MNERSIVQRYSSDMLIRDVLTSHPGAAHVFTELGLGCPSCLGAEMETVASVASMHDVPVSTLLDALEALGERPIEARSGDHRGDGL